MHAVGTKCVEGGGFDLLVSVAADVVGTERINRDEKDVWGFVRGSCLTCRVGQ
jgi:hypothetical protein